MIKQILQSWYSKGTQPGAVLCSVVQWKGSVPRKDYPMMLVFKDGSTIGTIGGGSMELKITKAAVESMGSTNPSVFDFDMTGTDVRGDVGLCGGTLTILVEPFSDTVRSFYDKMLDQMSDNPKLMVKLKIEGNSNVEVVRELIHHRADFNEQDPALTEKCQGIFENQQTRSFEHQNHRYLLWQPFTPPVIHLFGAGHVGQAVADLAHFNGLELWVYDDRLELMTPERFPHAKMIETEFPINWQSLPTIPSQHFIIIASREHRHDRELLQGLLRAPRNYVGLVSSSRKWKILAESLLEDGLSPDQVSVVHAPVGLDIAAQTVPEIAISIIAEVIQEYRKF